MVGGWGLGQVCGRSWGVGASARCVVDGGGLGPRPGKTKDKTMVRAASPRSSQYHLRGSYTVSSWSMGTMGSCPWVHSIGAPC